MHSAEFSEPSDERVARTESEQARLDAAIRRADDLLVSSLKTDDRRRKRRLRTIVLAGGFAMFATAACVLIAWNIQGQVASNAAPKEIDTGDKSGQLTQEGWRLWQARDLEAATTKFEEAVKLAPKNTNAWNGLGWSRFNAGQYTAAEKAFQSVIALEPKHPAALNGLGQTALARRNYKQAEKYLLKAAPQASAAWYGLAKLYLLEGKFDDAKRWAKKIVDSGQGDQGAKQMLEAAQAGKLDPALRAQIEPAGGNALRGWELFNQGRRVEAKAVFEAALADDPNNVVALNGMGWCLFNAGQAAEAKPYFQNVIAADPNLPNAAGGTIGLARFLTSRNDWATAEIQIAIAMNGLARVLKSEGDLDGAMKIWTDMAKRFPGVTAATHGLADAYLEKGDFKKAVPLLEQIVKASPNNEQLQAKLARAREQADK